jgi:ABC-2 type transport system permease protein
MLAIFRKEMRAYFLSPMAYIVMAIFLFLSGILFFVRLEYFSEMRQPGMDMNITEFITRPLFNNLSFLFLIILPIITMRTLAEEKKQGTLELLFTYPLTEWQMIMGKFLGALCVPGAIILLTSSYFVLLHRLSSVGGVSGVEWPAVLSGYLGLLLMTTAFLSLGLWASSITEHQVVAFILSFGVSLFLWIANWLQQRTSGPMYEIFQALSIQEHFENFSKGVIHTTDILYYICFALFFLFMTSRNLEARKWRG